MKLYFYIADQHVSQKIVYFNQYWLLSKKKKYKLINSFVIPRVFSISVTALK